MDNFDALDLAWSAAKEWLAGLDDRPVIAAASLEELRRCLGGPLQYKGECAKDVIEHLLGSVKNGVLGCASGRFFAWVIGGSHPSALAAD